MARRIEGRSRRLLLGPLFFAVLAAVDLPTRWFLGDRRLDGILLFFAAAGGAAAISMWRLARRLRAGEPVRRVAPKAAWAYIAARFAIAFAATAFGGYLIGGWIWTFVLGGISMAVVVAATAIGLRRRGRRPRTLA